MGGGGYLKNMTLLWCQNACIDGCNHFPNVFKSFFCVCAYYTDISGGSIFKFTGGDYYPLGKLSYRKRLGKTRVNSPVFYAKKQIH